MDKRKRGRRPTPKDASNKHNTGKSESSTASAISSSRKKKRKLPTSAQSLNLSTPMTKADHDATLALLKTMDWTMAKNTSRRNVIRADDRSTPRNKMNKPYCMSFIFGRNMKDPTGGMSWWSTKYPDVYAKLQALISKYDSKFSYTHITLNCNLRCKRHTDGGNAGPSYIAAFGHFKGGELIVEQPGGGMPETALDCKSKFVMFNGKTQPHETVPFTGERFTLVYYTSDIVPEKGAVDRRMAGRVSAAGVSSGFKDKFEAIKSKLGRKKRK